MTWSRTIKTNHKYYQQCTNYIEIEIRGKAIFIRDEKVPKDAICFWTGRNKKPRVEFVMILLGLNFIDVGSMFSVPEANNSKYVKLMGD